MSVRVLVAEDEPDILLIARAALKRADFDVVTATNGREAIAAARTHQPALVVLDCMMPEIDGFEACARLQADPATRMIPIVFLTATADDAVRKRCTDLGAVGCIAKPFDPLRLGTQVRAFLSPGASLTA